MSKLELMYADKAMEYYASARVEILPLLPSTVGRVLEVGCGTGSTLAWLGSLEGKGVVALWGVEPYAPAASAAAAKADRVLNCAAEEALPQLAGEQFDCILCLDVLEHFEDPWTVIAGLSRLLSAEGVLIVSVPNLRYWQVLSDLVLAGEFEYQQSGILDKTHLRFFTKKSIKRLIEGAGLKNVEILHHPKDLSWKFSIISQLSCGRIRDIFAWQILARASH